MSENKLNAVAGFDPTLCKLKEDSVIPLEARKLWFWLAHPTGRLMYKQLSLSDKLAVIEARVYPDNSAGEDGFLANGFGMAVRGKDDLTGEFIRQAADSALDHALTDAGFGIQYQVETPETETPKPKRTAKASKTAPAEETPPVGEPPTEQPKAVEESAPAPEEAKPAPVEEEPSEKSEETTPAAEEPKAEITELKAADSNADSSVEKYMASMNIQEAISTVVEFGALKGKTLGQIVKEDPKQILWLRDSYKGPDNHLRAAAAYLLEQAGDRAAA